MKRICKICGKIFFAVPARKNAKTCSFKCKGISRRGIPTWNKGKHHLAGSKNPMWKGGIWHDIRGYILIHKPNHPFCNVSGYVYKHRLVMEKHIGRFLKSTERIHHINHNKSDNRFKNLMLFINEIEHQKFHTPKGIKVGQNQE